MTRCTKCGALAEKIYAFGSTAPAKTIFMCLCWAASEVGVPDEEFEEYRKGILRTLKDEARGDRMRARWRWAARLGEALPKVTMWL